MSNFWKKLGEVAIDVAVVALVIVAAAIAEGIAKTVGGREPDEEFGSDDSNK